MGGMTDRKKSARIKRLPYSMQERVFAHERFPLLTGNGETLQIDMLEATCEQLDQLCDGDSVRNLAEQKAYQETRAILDQEKPEVMPYTVAGGRVSFRRGVTLTRAELKRLLQEM